MSEACTLGMAAEGRQKFPSTLGMAVEGRQKSLLYLVLYVCSIGSALAPPMTPSEGAPHGSLRSAEAHGVEFALLGHTVGHTIYVQGVLAVHTSDIDKTHHTHEFTVSGSRPQSSGL
eukprot:COSAG02_NODE_1414_length_12746_cov_3.904698_7_plen_117_part_00